MKEKIVLALNRMKEKIVLAFGKVKEKVGLATKWLTAFLKKRYKVVIAVLSLAVIITTTVITLPLLLDKGGKGREHGKGLNIAFLKGLSIDLNGITALAIEKRPTTNKTVQGVSYSGLTERSFSYADEISDEKYKLVGEKEDKSVEEITLRTKLGEIYQQDDLQAEFNKLCVSGDFIYFELIPDDTEEQQAEDGSYEYVDEGGVERSTRLTQRDNVSEANLEEFDKESNPSPLVGIFVYSIENEKIYDLSSVGYEVAAKEVVRVSGKYYRPLINENDEYEIRQIANVDHLQNPKFEFDKYGNVFIKNGTTYNYANDGLTYVDSENRAFYYAAYTQHQTPSYVITNESVALKLIVDGNYNSTAVVVDCKVIEENGMTRDLLPTDNFSYNWNISNKLNRIQEDPELVFIGIRNGEIISYSLFPKTIRPDEIKNSDIVKRVWIDKAIAFKGSELLLWDMSTDEVKTICNLPQQYTMGYAYDPGVTWTELTVEGKTVKEVYYNEISGEVEVRIYSEYIAPPKEVNTFQPIG